MTNEEREQAKSELMQIYMSLSEEKKKALDMAFKAMEQADGEKTCGTCRNEDTYHCADCENKSDYEQVQADGEYITQSAGDEIRQKNYDLISRQAVLEAIDVKAWEFCDYLISKNRNDEQKPVSHFADNLRECVREELPSVKQEPCEDANANQHNSNALNDVGQHINALEVDVISRQDAYKCLEIHGDYDTLNEVYGRLQILPSVNPQEKTGHWEEVGEEYIQVYDLNGIPSCGDERICSECGFETVFIGEHCSQYKFCPNCGCRMVDPHESEG